MKKHLITAILVLGACAPKEPPAPVYDAATDKAAIDAVRNAEMTGLNSNKADWVGTVYANDVHFMAPDEAAVHGSAGVTSMLEGMYKAMNVSGQYTSSDVTISGDYAIDRYTAMLQMSPFNGGKRVNETIKGVHVFKRQADGKWLIVQDVWNVDPPPANTK